MPEIIRNINDIYRFTLIFPTLGTVQVTPQNEQVTWAFEKLDDAFFYRMELQNDLLFEDKVNQAIKDFTKLYEHDRSKFSCEPVELIVERKCGEVWSEWYKGDLHVVDGDWNPDACEVQIKPRTIDAWSCIENNYKKEINLFERISDRKSLTTILARIERKTCYLAFQQQAQVLLPNAPNSNCLGNPVPMDWSVEKQDFTTYYNGFIAWIHTTWIREIYEYGNQYGPPAGSGWTDRGNGVYTRQIPTTLVDSSIEEITYNSVLLTQQIDTYEPVFPLYGAIDNGLRLRTVIDKLFENCTEVVRSDFYGLNPDGTAPDNEPYQKAAEEAQDLYAYQITDIKDIDASENATNFPMSKEKLINNLRIIHNVHPGIGDDGNFRLEHISYWEGKLMLDLTAAGVVDYIKGSYKYKYEKLDLPKKETWMWLDSTPDTDFKGVPIIYDSCFNEDKNSNEKTYSADYTVTDIVNLRRNVEAASNDGMALIAGDGSGLIRRDTGLLSGLVKLNASLSFANLLYNYHRWERPQMSGRMNNNDEIFETKMHTRKQDPVSVPICCEDALAFDPKDKVKTQMGWGVIETATLTDPEGELELNIRHQ